jgi:hypothetical protein
MSVTSRTTKDSRRMIAYARPPLYPRQEAAIFHPTRYVIIEATPKSGKTVGCLAWLVEQAVQGRAGDQYWWIAPVVEQARMVWERLKRGLPHGSYVSNESRQTVVLPNQATIAFKSADHPDTLYGEDVRAAVIDEAPRCKEAAWHAVRTTLTATNGPIRIIGNVKGRRNWAYRMARQAEAGEPDMHFARLTALDAIEAGIFNAAELEDARRRLPSDVFRELYYAEASDDQGNPFGLEAIRLATRGLSDQEPAVWGWDLAKSIDWSVGIALDAHGVVCAFERFQRSWEDTIETIRRTTGSKPALIDSTGVGDPILERLQRCGPWFEGFRFSASSKQQLMEGLAVAIQQRRVAFPAGPIVAELEAFEYQYSRTGVQYAAPIGIHDDCVCALGLAVRHYVPKVEGKAWLSWDDDLSDESHEKYIMDHLRRNRSYFPGD